MLLLSIKQSRSVSSTPQCSSRTPYSTSEPGRYCTAIHPTTSHVTTCVSVCVCVPHLHTPTLQLFLFCFLSSDKGKYVAGGNILASLDTALKRFVC